ncbi:hypothetical protein JYU34_009316 [Plutella xylostella]|uniref:Uncharacterized protein n=1 Tax=Plutella xylostella TaxID=51655 RepID=A0ABQ7QMQ2_PLUXY|nr:hypothetical protein JYU34_009316 [Plutella xylostella]
MEQARRRRRAAPAAALVSARCRCWHGEQRAQLLALLQAWSKPGAAAALQLLLPW